MKITYGSITPAEAGDNVYNLCADYCTLQANGSFNGIGCWTLVHGSGKFDDMYSARTVVRGLDKGRNTFKWTIKYNSGEVFDTVQIWNMQVTQAEAGTDRTNLCQDWYELQGNALKLAECEHTIQYPQGHIPASKLLKFKTHWEVISGRGEWLRDAQKLEHQAMNPQDISTPLLAT